MDNEYSFRRHAVACLPPGASLTCRNSKLLAAATKAFHNFTLEVGGTICHYVDDCCLPRCLGCGAVPLAGTEQSSSGGDCSPRLTAVSCYTLLNCLMRRRKKRKRKKEEKKRKKSTKYTETYPFEAWMSVLGGLAIEPSTSQLNHSGNLSKSARCVMTRPPSACLSSETSRPPPDAQVSTTKRPRHWHSPSQQYTLLNKQGVAMQDRKADPAEWGRSRV